MANQASRTPNDLSTSILILIGLLWNEFSCFVVDCYSSSQSCPRRL